MSQQIFKYQLLETAIQEIEMPKGAILLCVQTQNNIPCLWVQAESGRELKKRTFEMFGTGQDLPEKGIRQYIGTCQLDEGQLVFHCYERLFH